MTRKIVEVVEDPKRRLLGTCKHSGPACWPCVADDMEAQRDAAEEREREAREALEALVALFPRGATLFCDGKTVMEKLHPDHGDAVPRFHHATDCHPCAVLKSARAALALGTGKGEAGQGYAGMVVAGEVVDDGTLITVLVPGRPKIQMSSRASLTLHPASAPPVATVPPGDESLAKSADVAAVPAAHGEPEGGER